MLCELYILSNSFLASWISVSLITFVFVMTLSSPVFYLIYWPGNVTYDMWRYKSNPKFPSPEKVRDEIITMCKGLICATFCPTLAVVLLQRGHGKAFCGWGGRSVLYHVMSFFVIMLISDFYEFLYHRLGHVDFRFWKHHKHHHEFFNPSPFSVIADEWIDQFMRSLPLIIIPLVAPVNMDLLFFEYGVFFYFYGVYLHSGYEVKWLSSHNKYVNTSFQHYCHHAKSVMNQPYHCGFFIKLWDQLFQCTYPEEKCFCAECSRNKGERTEVAFKEIVIPEYSKLLTSSLWLKYFTVPTSIK